MDACFYCVSSLNKTSLVTTAFQVLISKSTFRFVITFCLISADMLL